MTNAPTTRETADHIGEANEKVADHLGDATTMIVHAELARLAEAATLGKWQNGIDDCEGVVALAEHAGNVICLPPTDDMQASLEFWPRNAAFIAAANPATVLALLSEIAALRGDVAALDEMRGTVRVITGRLTQAERQRDELRKALKPFADIGSRYRTGGLRQDIESRAPSFMRLLDFKAFRHADSLIANQGADQ